MAEELMTIGKLATAAGVKPKTVRFYEAIGLIPKPRRGASGYRLYAETDIERITFIKQAQALGLSLKQVKALNVELTSGSCEMMRPKLLQLVNMELELTERRIHELRKQRRELQRRYRSIQNKPFSDHTARCGCLEDGPVLVRLPQPGTEEVLGHSRGHGRSAASARRAEQIGRR